MTSSPLQVPLSAIGTLTHAYTGSASDDSQIDVYFLSSSELSSTSLGSVCSSLTASYVRNYFGDDQVEEYQQFLTPIPSPFNCVQDCIDDHFDHLDKWLLDHPAPESDVAIYPYGIIVFDCDEQNALLVHIDSINKTWHIGSIHLPVADLSLEVTSLIMGDELFGDLCYKRDVRVPQNDPNIDENYKDHYKDESGSWKNNAPRFAVFSTGWAHALPVTGMLDDSYHDVPFGHSDVELYGLDSPHYIGDKNKLRAQFLVNVAADQRGEKRHEGKGPCPSCRPLHKNIFIDVDNDDPRVNGVLVCQMVSDVSFGVKSDEQLAEIGRKANIETRRVGVAFAVATAKFISSNGTDRTPPILQEKM
ncbi:hypothetical protein E4T47_07461 [Aureobasidium subglaciale]|nr:hypothetical protein E4T47_07461 [Aureobasidium subglaciale]